MLVNGWVVPTGYLPLLPVSKVVSDGIVGLFQKTVICITRSSFQELEDSKPISQFLPEADSKVPTNKMAFVRPLIYSFNFLIDLGKSDYLFLCEFW